MSRSTGSECSDSWAPQVQVGWHPLPPHVPLPDFVQDLCDIDRGSDGEVNERAFGRTNSATASMSFVEPMSHAVSAKRPRLEGDDEDRFEELTDLEIRQLKEMTGAKRSSMQALRQLESRYVKASLRGILVDCEKEGCRV